MKHIELLANFELNKISAIEKSKQIQKLFDGTHRQLINVELRNGEILSKHKAKEPITVFCLAGNGTFRAGKDLKDEQKLEAGMLITLTGGIEHEIVAEPDISLLVTKFKEI